MQTFLPHANFALSAACLDYRRLGKQRVEAKQIYNSLTEGGGWANHPATQMWEGYEPALAVYGALICTRWVSMGYRDTLLPWFVERVPQGQQVVLPPWVGDQRVHRSHRSNLLYKDYDHYAQFAWAEKHEPKIPYFWPKARPAHAVV